MIINFRKVDNHLYRSGVITKKGTKTLQRAHISLIIDLRFKEELEELPDYVPEGITYINIPLIEKSDTRLPSSYEEFLTSEKIYRVYDTYAAIAESETFKENVNKVLDIIEKHQGNILIHCTSGKDRTGVVSAIYLKNKGADLKKIHKDYLKSNRKYFLNGLIAYIVVKHQTHNKEKAKEVYHFYHLEKEYIDLFIK